LKYFLTCTSPAPIILWQADKIDAVLPKCLHAKTGCKMQDKEALR